MNSFMTRALGSDACKIVNVDRNCMSDDGSQSINFRIDYALHITLLSVLLIGLILLLTSPSLFLQFDYACVIRRLTHLNCPFCGMSRDFIAIANGHPLILNPFSPLVFFFAFIVCPSAVVFVAFRPRVLTVNYKIAYKIEPYPNL